MDPEELKKKAEADAAAAALAAKGTSGGDPAKPGGAPGVDDAAKLKKEAEDAKAALAALQAKVDADKVATQNHISALNAEAQKYRNAKTEAEKKAKAEADAALAQQGNYAALYEGEKKAREAAEAAALTSVQRAAKLDAIEARQKAELESAKAAGNLPPFVVMAIDLAVKAGDVDAGHAVLASYRDATKTAPGDPVKPPSNPLTPPGTTAPSPPSNKPLDQMTMAEMRQLEANPDEWNRRIGQASSNGAGTFDPAKWMDTLRR